MFKAIISVLNKLEYFLALIILFSIPLAIISFLFTFSIKQFLLCIAFLVILFFAGIVVEGAIDIIVGKKLYLYNDCREKEYIDVLTPLLSIKDDKFVSRIKGNIAAAFYHLGDFDKTEETINSIDTNILNKNDGLFLQVNSFMFAIAALNEDKKRAEMLYSKIKGRITEKNEKRFSYILESSEICLLELKEKKTKEEFNRIREYHEREALKDIKLKKVINYYYLLPIYRDFKDNDNYKKCREYILENGGDTFYVEKVRKEW